MDPQEILRQSILETAEATWKMHSRPAYLSELPPLLEAKVTDYKAQLGGKNLKSFIKSTEEKGKYRLVEHPTFHAQVGVVPKGVAFEYGSSVDEPTASKKKNNDDVVLAFLKALSALPQSDLDKIVLPATVLAKLLK